MHSPAPTARCSHCQVKLHSQHEVHVTAGCLAGTARNLRHLALHAAYRHSISLLSRSSCGNSSSARCPTSPAYPLPLPITQPLRTLHCTATRPSHDQCGMSPAATAPWSRQCRKRACLLDRIDTRPIPDSDRCSAAMMVSQNTAQQTLSCPPLTHPLSKQLWQLCSCAIPCLARHTNPRVT